MNNFAFVRRGEIGAAIKELATGDSVACIAGGTNILDLMKENVERPERLLDINRLPLTEISPTAAGGIRIGALVTNSEVAYNDLIIKRYPLLSQAILAGASPQIRNMATTGGNLLQRTRCLYFYDTATACNKREPGSGCAAIAGLNHNHAILGTSDSCIAVHPSDMCVALAALAAVVQVSGPCGERAIPMSEFHRLPGETPQRDTNLEHDELITAIELPARGFPEHCTYLKIRERTSYAFALVSVAAALEMDDEVVQTARIALGGVAHRPWRNQSAEQMLQGQQANTNSFERVAQAILHDARGFGGNDFKIELARRAIVRALTQAAFAADYQHFQHVQHGPARNSSR